ncbi:MAG: DUF1295 domain-containing protein [Lewinellaceae bacterium]|nr:DUF1295 domain-containing protein [Lewinellaceae bacterium]
MILVLIAATAILLYQLGWFVLAVIRRDNSLADIGWGLGFVLVAGLGWFLGNPTREYGVLVSMVALWGIRLAGHIWLRHRRQGAEDFRYRQWRAEWGSQWVWRSLTQVFMLQGFFMFIIALPIIGAAQQPLQGWPGFHFLGLFIFGVGWYWEALADYQLVRFKRNPDHRGRLLMTGLWRFSRHPNYFGEILVWWGIWIFTLPFTGAIVWVISPLTITWLLLRVSGVPLLEKKYQDHPEFAAYVRNTPAVWPRLRN